MQKFDFVRAEIRSVCMVLATQHRCINLANQDNLTIKVPAIERSHCHISKTWHKMFKPCSILEVSILYSSCMHILLPFMAYHRSGFDYEILMIVNCEFSGAHNQKNRKVSLNVLLDHRNH